MLAIRNLLFCVLALAPIVGDAAQLPVLTEEPADPAGYFRVNFVDFDLLNADSAGLFYARGSFSSTDPPTYVTLVDGRASFWLPGPINGEEDSVHALIRLNLPGWVLSSGGYIEDPNTWRMFLPIHPDTFPDFNLTGATELTLSMAAPQYAAGPEPNIQQMFVGMALSANNGQSKAVLWDWALKAVPEPTGAAPLTILAIGAAIYRERLSFASRRLRRPQG